MKNYIVIPVLLICFLVASEVTAQSGYIPPSRERVEALLEQIEDCKNTQKNLENKLAYIENNPENFTLNEYNEAKRYAKNAKACKNVLREKLEAIRKDYPRWFNRPNAAVGVSKPTRRAVTPREINHTIDKVDSSIARAIALLQAINVPEH